MTDGRGQQAFVLFVSRDPLPPFAAWRERLAGLPWRHSEDPGVWSIDGPDVAAVVPSRPGSVARGREVDRRPQPLASLSEFLGARAGVETVRGLAFPVR